MQKAVLMFSPQSNQVQTRHNIKDTVGTATNFALAGICFFAFTFLMHPVLITTVTVTFILLFE